MLNSLKQLAKGDNLTTGFGLYAIHYCVVENDPKSQRIRVSHKLFPSQIKWYKYSDFT